MVCFRYLPQHTSTNREPGAPSSAQAFFCVWASAVLLCAGFGYQPSAELMERLTPRRREILTDINHPWGLDTPAQLRGRHSPR